MLNNIMQIYAFISICAVPLILAALYVVHAVRLAMGSPTYLDPTHPQRRWLLVLIWTHLLEPLLTVPWVLIWLNMLNEWDKYILLGAFVSSLPMLMLLLPSVAPQGRTAQTTELIHCLRRFGLGRIGLNVLIWITIPTVMIPIVLVPLGAAWLGADLEAVRRELAALQKETWHKKQSALRRAEDAGSRADRSSLLPHN